MHHFWQLAIRPILEAVDPAVIVEIGVSTGSNTRNILDFCGSGTVLHAVDPEPQLNVDDWVGKYPGKLVFHRKHSLDVISDLPEFQVGLIDGDHNWYTVYNELIRISELHQNDPGKFPVLMFHDIAWPYARRDLYYAHRHIPDEFRQPFARKGIPWGRSHLSEDGGMNRQLDNATQEGGDRNGVLTAIEDFLQESPIDFDFVRIPAYFGLGILSTKASKAACRPLGEFLDKLTGTDGLMTIITTLEEIRAKAHIHQQGMRYELKELRRRTGAIEADSAVADVDKATVAAAPVLSIVMVVYDMRREAERTLNSLSRAYQRNIDDLDYEVIVVDNGSNEPLGEDFVRSHGECFSYIYLENAPKSPARAINVGAQKARGRVLAIMIDGAHVLTPGVLHDAMLAFETYDNPVVAPRYWFVGPGQQGETIGAGYDSRVEDSLISGIDWPMDGYRLFEIGVFIGPRNNWLSRFFESNCLFMRREVFDSIGGANERFDYPGGGFLNLDLLRESSEQDGVQLVTILGEATFHQLHGGITTNVPPELREERVSSYRKQYREIRGRDYQAPQCPVYYVGHLPNIARHQLAFKKP